MVDPAPIHPTTADQTPAMRSGILEFLRSLPDHLPPTRGDLILGFATGYKPGVVAPFVESLRAYGRFAGKVVLFVDPAATDMAAYLRAQGIEALAFDPAESPIVYVNLARSFVYFDYLRKQLNDGAVFNQILLTDVQDVIFQAPLFGTPCEHLEYHLEGPTIGEDWFTSRSLKLACGEQALQALSSLPISCAGTVSGRAAGIFDYLAQKLLLVLDLPERVRLTWGVDQGLHNYILHTGLTRAATSKPNFARVASLALVRGRTLTCDAAGRVVNPDGAMSEVAHQWNRHWHLSTRICEVYRQNRWYTRWRLWMALTQVRGHGPRRVANRITDAADPSGVGFHPVRRTAAQALARAADGTRPT